MILISNPIKMGTLITLSIVLLLFSVVASKNTRWSRDFAEQNTSVEEKISRMSENRIVGGYNASIEDFPYQVSFIANNSFFCGGFIISQTYILTAAHCIKDIDPSTIVLRLGSSWRKNGTIIRIAEVMAHPEYNNPTFDKDVGVMRTAEPINFTKAIMPIKLPQKNRTLVSNTIVKVSGWGKTKFSAVSIPDRLLAVEIPVISHYKCNLVYPIVLTDNEWCGGYLWFGGKGTCQGDSGGVAEQDGVAVGIVSFGRGCAYPLSPSVFANLAAPDIRDFIIKITGL